jgi:hypothetical protein
LAFDPLFTLGRVVTTGCALQRLDANGIDSFELVIRHVTGDWGELSDEDQEANARAVLEGLRILSSYPMPDGTKVWVITEADRSLTTFLCPNDY